ncbi:hypothetical protein BLA29_015328 [Euroglyphus maynei]|uniref:Uncharacterized protein n=1 Tax=Euroglyphus maynei TaxID=6958 RepID=A0A1Y3APU5_EURMA|nr:hypothetical protein BLA29_015328 [Euroglyphus maynei]
MLHIEPMLMK